MSHLEKKTWWQRCLQVLLMPIVLPLGLLVIGLLSLVLLVVVPVFSIRGYFESKAMWARLRKRELVGEWPEVVKALESGGCTLIVETFKQPHCAVLIHHPRSSLDPERRIPTWHDFESGSFKAAMDKLEPAQRRTKIEEMFETQRCVKQKLFTIMESPETSLQAVQLRKNQLDELSQSVKEEQTIVLWVDHESDYVLQRLSVEHAVRASTG